MAIDKADWQFDSAQKEYCEKFGKKTTELTEKDIAIIWEYAGNHIAFLITWLLRHDLLGELHLDNLEAAEIEAVKRQEKTGMDILRDFCDMCFTSEDVADSILPKLVKYYDEKYLSDYGEFMGDKVLATEFSWEDYLGFEPILDKFFEDFL